MLVLSDANQVIGMSGFNRDRNIKIPKKVDKKPTVKSVKLPPLKTCRRRVEVPKKGRQTGSTQPSKQPTASRQKQRRNTGNRGNGRQRQQNRNDRHHLMMKYGQE